MVRPSRIDDQGFNVNLIMGSIPLRIVLHQESTNDRQHECIAD